MPNAKRRPDGEIHQEWAHDTSNDGKASGPHNLEVAFDGDDPDTRSWTTHLYAEDQPERRMSRGDRTAIVIAGVSRERALELTELVSGEAQHSRGSERNKILDLLAGDENLRWVA